MVADAHQKARGEIESYHTPHLTSEDNPIPKPSRNGVPLEIVSMVILRHQGLKTTQIYLGKVSKHEAIRWMDILHGK